VPVVRSTFLKKPWVVLLAPSAGVKEIAVRSDIQTVERTAHCEGVHQRLRAQVVSLDASAGGREVEDLAVGIEGDLAPRR